MAEKRPYERKSVFLYLKSCTNKKKLNGSLRLLNGDDAYHFDNTEELREEIRELLKDPKTERPAERMSDFVANPTAPNRGESFYAVDFLYPERRGLRGTIREAGRSDRVPFKQEKELIDYLFYGI